jgi:hypothetical protein
MDQVSRPMLLALAATVALAAVWLVALGHKPEEITRTPAAPVKALAEAGKASAASAKAAAPAKPASAKAAATPAKAVMPAKAATPAAPHVSAVNTGDAAVVRDLRGGKVVVMLFWNANAADDVATRDAVRALNRRGGRVAVHIVPIGRVGEYESITRGVTINQTPTTLVVDRRRRTHPIVGLTERGELTQAVDDALAGRH